MTRKNSWGHKQHWIAIFLTLGLWFVVYIPWCLARGFRRVFGG